MEREEFSIVFSCVYRNFPILELLFSFEENGAKLPLSIDHHWNEKYFKLVRSTHFESRPIKYDNVLASVWPASLSVMASTLAAPFVLGVPAEIYAHGTTFAFVTVGYVIGVPLCSHLFFTRFYDMGISSIYEVATASFRRTSLSI